MPKNKSKFKSFKFLVVGLGFFFYFLALRKAKAQSFSLSISPPLLKIMMKPGKTITQVYKLTNQGSDNLIKTNVSSFEPSDELGNIKINSLTPISNQKSFLSWFSFQNADLNLKDSFNLKSGQTQELVLKIKVPEDAEEKDYYASLLFQTQPQGKIIVSNTSQASGILTSNVLLTVSKDGKPPKSGQITELSVKKPFLFIKSGFFNHQPLFIFDSFDSIPFTLRVANTGRTVFKPIGSVKIFGPKQKEVEFLEILPQNILSFSSRKLFLKGNQEKPLREISWQPRGLKIGRYQARANLILSGSSKKLKAEVSFFLFPWKAGLGLAIALILVSIVRGVIRSKY